MCLPPRRNRACNGRRRCGQRRFVFSRRVILRSGGFFFRPRWRRLPFGGREMAQNLTSGSQAFGMASVSGSTGKTVAIVDGEGSVLGSFTAVYDFDTVVASVSGMQDGEVYGIVAADSLEGANEDGYASSGTLSAVDAMELVVSTSAQSGLGGPGRRRTGRRAWHGGRCQTGSGSAALIEAVLHSSFKGEGVARAPSPFSMPRASGRLVKGDRRSEQRPLPVCPGL